MKRRFDLAIRLKVGKKKIAYGLMGLGVGVMSLGLSVGCANSERNDFKMIRDVLALAKEDKVKGHLKIHLNGKMEAGVSESVYLGSPGSVIDGELKFP